jgi:hypothetical protein
MQRGDYFEPIYSYRNTEKALFVGKLFSEFDPQLSPTIRAVFNKLVKPYFKKICSPLRGISENIYKAKKPLLLSTIVEILTKKKETKSPDHPEGSIKLINSEQRNKQRSNIFHETIE